MSETCHRLVITQVKKNGQNKAKCKATCRSCGADSPWVRQTPAALDKWLEEHEREDSQ